MTYEYVKSTLYNTHCASITTIINMIVASITIKMGQNKTCQVLIIMAGC